MANNLLYAVVQYNKPRVPQRMYVNYEDDVTKEVSENLTNRDDMGSPDKQIFDNFKQQVEQHVINGGILLQAVVQYGIEGFPERMIVQFSKEGEAQTQVEILRADMVNPDAQIFDNFKNLVEQHMI